MRGTLLRVSLAVFALWFALAGVMNYIAERRENSRDSGIVLRITALPEQEVTVRTTDSGQEIARFKLPRQVVAIVSTDEGNRLPETIGKNIFLNGELVNEKHRNLIGPGALVVNLEKTDSNNVYLTSCCVRQLHPWATNVASVLNSPFTLIKWAWNQVS